MTTAQQHKLEPLEFEKLVVKELREAHCAAGLDVVSAALSELKSTAARMSLLKLTVVRPPVLWADVSSSSVETVDEFCLLQGDLVSTRRVKRWGLARSEQSELDTWVVITPTCDLVVRDSNKAPIRVSPAHVVRSSFRKSTDVVKTNNFKSLALLSNLRSTRGFPYPATENDDEEVLGYFCDFEEVCALDRSDVAMAAPLASLTPVGWHLFAAALRRSETKGNVAEEEQIRSVAF